MINGVNFQPGAAGPDDPRRRPSGSSDGVQEAIKVLSLRLPKVVGAQAVAPSALLTSQGGGGNPHIDSIVESVLSKMFPTAGAGPSSAPAAPMIPTQSEPQAEAPQFSGNIQGGSQPKTEQREEPNFWSQFPRTPNIIVDNPGWTGDFTGPVGDFTMPGSPGYQGGPQQPSMIAPAPDLRKYLDWVPRGPGHNPSETPLF